MLAQSRKVKLFTKDGHSLSGRIEKKRGNNVVLAEVTLPDGSFLAKFSIKENDILEVEELDDESESSATLGGRRLVRARHDANPHLQKLAGNNIESKLLSYQVQQDELELGMDMQKFYLRNIPTYSSLERYLENSTREKPAIVETPAAYFVVKAETDFSAAICLVLRQSAVGLVFVGTDVGRNGQLIWVLVSTPDVVLMFDILALGRAAFSLDSQSLFHVATCSSLVKVIHDCREISDMLAHQYNCRPVNVWDTQVADLFAEMQSSKYHQFPSYVRPYFEMVQRYIGNEAYQLALAEKYREGRKASAHLVWAQRPTTEKQLNRLAFKVMFHLRLHRNLQEILNLPFHQATQLYLRSVRDLSQAQFENLAEDFESRLPAGFGKSQIPDRSSLMPSHAVNSRKGRNVVEKFTPTSINIRNSVDNADMPAPNKQKKKSKDVVNVAPLSENRAPSPHNPLQSHIPLVEEKPNRTSAALSDRLNEGHKVTVAAPGVQAAHRPSIGRKFPSIAELFLPEELAETAASAGHTHGGLAKVPDVEDYSAIPSGQAGRLACEGKSSSVPLRVPGSTTATLPSPQRSFGVAASIGNLAVTSSEDKVACGEAAAHQTSTTSSPTSSATSSTTFAATKAKRRTASVLMPWEDDDCSLAEFVSLQRKRREDRASAAPRPAAPVPRKLVGLHNARAPNDSASNQHGAPSLFSLADEPVLSDLTALPLVPLPSALAPPAQPPSALAPPAQSPSALVPPAQSPSALAPPTSAAQEMAALTIDSLTTCSATKPFSGFSDSLKAPQQTLSDSLKSPQQTLPDSLKSPQQTLPSSLKILRDSLNQTSSKTLSNSIKSPTTDRLICSLDPTTCLSAKAPSQDPSATITAPSKDLSATITAPSQDPSATITAPSTSIPVHRQYFCDSLSSTSSTVTPKSFSEICTTPSQSLNSIRFTPLQSLNSIRLTPSQSLNSIRFTPSQSLNSIRFTPSQSLNSIRLAPSQSLNSIRLAPSQSHNDLSKSSLQSHNDSSKSSLQSHNDSSKSSLQSHNDSSKSSLQSHNDSSKSSLQSHNDSSKFSLQSHNDSSMSLMSMRFTPPQSLSSMRFTPPQSLNLMQFTPPQSLNLMQFTPPQSLSESS